MRSSKTHLAAALSAAIGIGGAGVALASSAAATEQPAIVAQDDDGTGDDNDTSDDDGTGDDNADAPSGGIDTGAGGTSDGVDLLPAGALVGLAVVGGAGLVWRRLRVES